MRRDSTLRLFQTLEHGCGYYPDRLAKNLVVDPLAPELPKIYGQALAQGFRRAGGHLYRPNCSECSLCLPCRVTVADFQPDRSQRRCLRDNADVSLVDAEPRLDEELFALYRHYLSARHPQGGMDDPSHEDFSRFLLCDWSGTRFLELREGSRLLGVAVSDRSEHSLSAVYTFFDPEPASRSLGKLAILLQLEFCRRQKLKHLYLGYWLENHPKMHYKRSYRPMEVLRDGSWESLP